MANKQSISPSILSTRKLAGSTSLRTLAMPPLAGNGTYTFELNWQEQSDNQFQGYAVVVSRDAPIRSNDLVLLEEAGKGRESEFWIARKRKAAFIDEVTGKRINQPVGIIGCVMEEREYYTREQLAQRGARCRMA